MGPPWFCAREVLAAEGIAGEVARLLMVERVGVEIQLANEIHNEEGGFFFFFR